MADRPGLGLGTRSSGLGTAVWWGVRLAWWVTVASLAMRVLPMPRAIGLVAQRRPARRPPLSDAERRQLAYRLDRVLSVNRLTLTPVCWKRAIVLQRYLALGGVDSRVVFGVRKPGGGPLDGHAWVEVAGVPVLESEPPSYTPTYVFP